MKPDDGVWIETVSDIRIEIEGRLNGRSPIRAIVEYDQPVCAQVVSVSMLDLPALRNLNTLISGVIDAVTVAQREMEKVHDAPAVEYIDAAKKVQEWIEAQMPSDGREG